MLRNVFVYKIQCDLSCSKSGRKVSGLSRNVHLDMVQHASYSRNFFNVLFHFVFTSEIAL